MILPVQSAYARLLAHMFYLAAQDYGDDGMKEAISQGKSYIDWQEKESAKAGIQLPLFDMEA